MKWHKAAIAAEQVQRLAKRYGIDQLTAAILIRRGITAEHEICFLFDRSLPRLHNPFLFEEMEQAVDRIRAARRESEKILIFGDRDADGITAIALLVRTLAEYGLEADWGLPLGDEPYGLTLAAVERFAAEDGSLIIAVDCGSTNYAEIKRAKELGIDTIVIDHHILPEQLPPAYAIINPKLPDSSYPFDGLCGCALAFKLRQALLFAEGDHYKQRFCLLNTRPVVTDSEEQLYAIELLKVVNMEPVEHLEEQIVPGRISIADSRLASFASGCTIVVYDAALQSRTLRTIFGNGFDIELEDIAPRLISLYPALKDKGLLQIGEDQRFQPYIRNGEHREIDVLYRLFLCTLPDGKLVEQISSALDLVGLGTIADLMPLQNENRILVQQGLQRLASAATPGLRALLSKQKLLGRGLSAHEVGYRITPILNACGRLGQPDHAVRLLLADDEIEAARLADEAISLNSKRRKMGEDGWHKTLEQARKSLEQHGGKLIFVFDPAIQRGITGILAGRFCRTFNVPAIVATRIDERIMGSMRSLAGFGVTTFLQRFADILTDWGGHDAAGGFQLEAGQLYKLGARMEQQTSSADMSVPTRVEERFLVDAEVPPSYLTPDLRRIVQGLGPYGNSNPPLTLMSRALRMREISIIGQNNDHVRMSLIGERHTWPAIFWKGAQRIGSDLKVGVSVDLLFRLENNYYNNQETLRLNVLDIRRTGSSDT